MARLLGTLAAARVVGRTSRQPGVAPRRCGDIRRRPTASALASRPRRAARLDCLSMGPFRVRLTAGQATREAERAPGGSAVRAKNRLATGHDAKHQDRQPHNHVARRSLNHSCQLPQGTITLNNTGVSRLTGCCGKEIASTYAKLIRSWKTHETRALLTQ